jgi:hypothetical protein
MPLALNLRRVLAGVLLVATTSCGGGSTSPTSSAGPSDGSGPSGDASARVTLVGDGPVLEASLLGGRGAALPAAYVVAAGVQHAYVVGFGDAIGDQQVYHATSTDGRAWTIDPSPPFGGAEADFSPPGPVPTSLVQLADGSWAMYVWGTPVAGSDAAVIWRATADSAAGPWTMGAEPVLERGDAAAWDGAGIDFPSVVPADDGYLMLFSGVGSADRDAASIGVATSPDGVSWTKSPDPVMGPGLCGGFDERSVGLPRLLRTDAGYTVVYAGYTGDGFSLSVGLARSRDGLAWSCASPNPLFTGGDLPGSEGIHTIAVATDGATTHLLLESLIGGGSEVWLAELDVAD